LMLPVLSGVADYSGRKLFFLKIFTTLGSISCAGLFFFKGMPQVGIALTFFILATIGFDGGKVFYNSYLPLISTPDRYDRVSAKGFAFGYIGSVILLLLNLWIILQPSFFGIPGESSLSVRLAFLMVGIWWIGFAQITFRRMPGEVKSSFEKKVMQKGLNEIKQVWRELKPQTNLKRFLISFFCYSAGVQTILYLAATFAEKELHFNSSELILVIIILQLVAIGGAYLFAYVSKIRGNKISLMSMLIIWVLICILAYYVIEKIQFYLIATLVGLVMGGIQSMSRSTYSKLISNRQDDTTSYFSFYEVLEKIAIVFGTFSFGFLDQVSGGMRNSVLLLGIYFIIGMILLWKVKLVDPDQLVFS
ncbi:MAG: MFS transporter, partial [Saprospiraceae bacterium]|nr:MFS transporter [Saprospiraceae bacterium]